MEKTLIYCPSCGSEMHGAYCPACGEKVSADRRELTFTYFAKEAFEEVFNVDSKFVRTLRLLLTRPGFLTQEVLAGRKVLYIKPVRIYTIVVVLHFVIFSFASSGDLFSTERFPIMKMMPDMQQWISSFEAKSGLTHVNFTNTLNQNMKDDLNVIFYFLPFLLALYFKLLYSKSGKFYVEHLYYILHLITFGLIRNIILLPLLMIDWVAVAFALSIMTQLAYTYISLRDVYRESPPWTALKVFLGLAGFMVMFIPAWFLALWIGIVQILY